MNNKFHPTLYWAYDYLSMLDLKYISWKGPQAAKSVAGVCFKVKSLSLRLRDGPNDRRHDTAQTEIH